MQQNGLVGYLYKMYHHSRKSHLHTPLPLHPEICFSSQNIEAFWSSSLKERQRGSFLCSSPFVWAPRTKMQILNQCPLPQQSTCSERISERWLLFFVIWDLKVALRYTWAFDSPYIQSVGCCCLWFRDWSTKGNDLTLNICFPVKQLKYIVHCSVLRKGTGKVRSPTWI